MARGAQKQILVKFLVYCQKHVRDEAVKNLGSATVQLFE